MKQYEAVIETLEKNNGIATLGFLYKEVFKIQDCEWKTKTPFASIRCIVQTNKEIYKIKPGLYALTKYRHHLTQNGIAPQEEVHINEEFNHAYYQGLLVEIGNMKNKITYIPAQDKNKLFLNKKLSDIVSTSVIFDFSYPEIVSRAKTIDVIWFNNNKLLESCFEIEHSTDIQNSLLKFFDLQDFYTKFNIVADQRREAEFKKKISYKAFDAIKTRVSFLNYEDISKLHTNLSQLITSNNLCLAL